MLQATIRCAMIAYALIALMLLYFTFFVYYYALLRAAAERAPLLPLSVTASLRLLAPRVMLCYRCHYMLLRRRFFADMPPRYADGVTRLRAMPAVLFDVYLPCHIAALLELRRCLIRYATSFDNEIHDDTRA